MGIPTPTLLMEGNSILFSGLDFGEYYRLWAMRRMFCFKIA